MRKRTLALGFLTVAQSLTLSVAMDYRDADGQYRSKVALSQSQSQVSLYDIFTRMIKDLPTLNTEPANFISRKDILQKYVFEQMLAAGAKKTSDGRVIPTNTSADIDILPQFCLTTKSLRYDFSLDQIKSLAAEAKYFGEGNTNELIESKINSVSKEKSPILQTVFAEPGIGSIISALFSSAFQPKLTTYGLFAQILKKADELKKRNDTNLFFVENYNDLKRALEGLDKEAKQSRISVLYSSNRDELASILEKAIDEGKIEEKWLLEQLSKR